MTPALSHAGLNAQCAVEGQSHLSEQELKLESLQQDYAELNTAIFEAAQVHRRLCAPRLVRHGAFDVASEIFAVRHLPGDFFSVEETPKGLVLALGDIGGKGLAAGMWVTHLIGLLRTHTAANSDPEAIVAGVNRDIARLSSVEPLSTMFVARLDSRSGILDYCSAGHPPALHLRANGELGLLSEGGPMLGVVPAATFDRGSVLMDRDDLLLVCSDGIPESFNEAEQEFGAMRLQTELRRAQGGSAESVLFSVLGAVQDFAAPRPLTDDMTLVVIKNNRESIFTQRRKGAKETL
ncbi:MAG TPA: PP2C family protein-serine/threonine phosphatase [Pyrinomonadaceae bacterium]|nr:PP2C family protein-serine/threonine phosphatase [Pyrinomonadaceae bacterium]